MSGKLSPGERCGHKRRPAEEACLCRFVHPVHRDEAPECAWLHCYKTDDGSWYTLRPSFVLGGEGGVIFLADTVAKRNSESETSKPPPTFMARACPISRVLSVHEPFHTFSSRQEQKGRISFCGRAHIWLSCGSSRLVAAHY